MHAGYLERDERDFSEIINAIAYVRRAIVFLKNTKKFVLERALEIVNPKIKIDMAIRGIDFEVPSSLDRVIEEVEKDLPREGVSQRNYEEVCRLVNNPNVQYLMTVAFEAYLSTRRGAEVKC